MIKNRNSHSLRWLYLAVGGVTLLFIGVIYAWSIFKVPLGQAFQWSDSQLSLAYTLTMCFFCLGSLISGWLVKRLSLRTILFISAAAILAGYVWTVNMSGSILMLYLAYSALIGGGVGIAYNTIVSLGNAWFPDKKGICSGIMMMCFGFSTMVVGKVSARLFDVPQVGWQKTFLGLGVLISLILVICAMVLKAPGAGANLPAPKPARGRKENFEQRDFSTREMLRRPSFWICYVYGTFHAAVGSAMFNFAGDVTKSFGATAAMATTLVSVLSICNGLGRVLCGLAFDYLGRKMAMFLSNVITVLSPGIMLVALAADSLPLAVVSICLAGLSYGTSPTISSTFTAAFYGTRDFALNYSVTNTKLLFASFAATVTSALLTATGTYMAPFALLLGLAVAAFVLNFFIRRP